MRESVPLDAALTGSLPCFVCGYELQGLSIRGVCPECGTAIRATILYKVDPLAEEFRPMPAPRLTAACLLLWALGALVSALALWALRGFDIAMTLDPGAPRAEWLRYVVVFGAAASGAAALGLIRPLRETPRRRMALAAAGCLAYVPLVWALYAIQVWDSQHLPAYFQAGPQAERIALRLLLGACLIVILLALRPIVRDLVRRSLALRTGRVDRQTILAMAMTIAVTGVGDLIRLVAAWRQATESDLLAVIGTFVIALGSFLVTLGFLAGVVDSWRIARALVIPSPSLRRLVGEPRPDGSA